MGLKRKRESESSLTPGFQPEQLQLTEMIETVGAAGGELREVEPRVPAGMCEGHWIPVGCPGGGIQSLEFGERSRFPNLGTSAYE